MHKIMFVCHGNICRSTMAESVMTYLVRQRGLEREFVIESSATSSEEIGNGVHYGTRAKLREVKIPVVDHRAIRLTREDYDKYDLIIGMDSANIRNILRIVSADPAKKVCRLLDFTPHPRDIADPWYTGDFDATYADVLCGCEALLKHLLSN